MEALFMLLIVLAAVVGLVWLGYVLASDRLAADRDALAHQRQVLDVEWQALENSRQINDVFFRARQAMREAEGAKHPRS
ncbi:MAG: hypothetical protein LC776_06965 [Acidobacteria bacterium]|nr:hypothetical protein [Acidobacteriota bacterium]